MSDIAPIDNRPWIPRPIPSWLIKELVRRGDDIGINYTKTSGWDDGGNWNNYKGPLTPWVRVCSNGTGLSKFLKPYKNGKDKYDGFVLYGGQNFTDTFGIGDNKNVLGYEVDGTPHKLPLTGGGFNYTLANSGSNRTVPMYLPSPGITSVEATIQKELIRSVVIKWNCYGFAQLEYMTPYFLTPRISTIVEFGWNHFNTDSLLDLTNDPHKYQVLSGNATSPYKLLPQDSGSTNITALKLTDIWQDGNPLYDCNIRISKGMYDVTFGLISDFEFSTQDGIKWDCSTTISSKHRNFSGVSLRNPNVSEVTGSSGGILIQSMTFPEFVDKRLKKVKNAVLQRQNFFEPLDSAERDLKLKHQFNLDTDKSKFYGGNPENRVFFGRHAAKNANFTLFTNNSYANYSENGNWDYGDNDSVWVTGGFLIELCNYFLTKPSDLKTSDNKTFQFYNIGTEGHIIGAHENLISTDGSVLLIPNRNAPKYSNGWGYKRPSPDAAPSYDRIDNQTFSGTNVFLSSVKPYIASKSTYADSVLWKTFMTGKQKTGGAIIARDDLDGIINAVRYKSGAKNGEYSFPQYTITDKYTKKDNNEIGKYGFFEDLYINVTHIIDTAKNSKTVGEFFNNLLDSLNQVTNGFWDLKIIESPNNLMITDQKHFSPKDFQSTDVYQFDLSSGRSIVKNLSFISTISNIQANQNIAASSNNQMNGENSTSAPLGFVFGDRFFTGNGTGKPQNKKSIQNTQVIQQLQKYGVSDDTVDARYIMTFKNDATAQSSTDINVVTLALPNKELLTSLLNDNDEATNVNVYGGQQPNFTLELTLQGIAGFRTFQCFSIKNFPRPYSDQDVIFQIVDVTHTVTSENWETRIKAGIRPLKGPIPNYVDGTLSPYK